MWYQISIHTHIYSHVLQSHLRCCLFVLEIEGNKTFNCHLLASDIALKETWYFLLNTSIQKGHSIIMTDKDKKQDKSQIICKHSQKKNMVKTTRLPDHVSFLLSFFTQSSQSCVRPPTPTLNQGYWLFFLEVLHLKQKHASLNLSSISLNTRSNLLDVTASCSMTSQVCAWCCVLSTEFLCPPNIYILKFYPPWWWY